ncbi:MAG TPA: MarR family winged helix-turn-helix transcriptional regulator [Calditrichia bacterium]|nr:winged helix-turn-helix transcriptional regulator [Calditrichota bacterium]HQU72617.1 MarR family winged helix-turn-helix transcriptional regulator [Calditrichia bacterium]HQV31576.1 MarR family winged helix-turn-helix transcriptional regulator [Calditrichia bacterium]
MNLSPFDLPFQNADTDSRILVALERLSEVFRVLLWETTKKNGLSPIQNQFLVFLDNHPVKMRKVSQLAEEFNMTKATVSDAVKALENKGLIEKQPDPGDSRSYFIEVTAAGHQTARESAHFGAVLLESIASLPEGEKAALLLTLMRLIDDMQKTGTIAVQRMCFSCRYYDPEQKNHPHYCQLLNRPMATTDLRLDCPEHESKTIS